MPMTRAEAAVAAASERGERAVEVARVKTVSKRKRQSGPLLPWRGGDKVSTGRHGVTCEHPRCPKEMPVR